MFFNTSLLGLVTTFYVFMFFLFLGFVHKFVLALLGLLTKFFWIVSVRLWGGMIFFVMVSLLWHKFAWFINNILSVYVPVVCDIYTQLYLDFVGFGNNVLGVYVHVVCDIYTQLYFDLFRFINKVFCIMPLHFCMSLISRNSCLQDFFRIDLSLK